MAVQATYTLEIDWDGSGTFDGNGEDASSDWTSATIRRGFAHPLARYPFVGRASFLLKNADKAYSPPAEANVLPRREVRFQMTYSGTTTTLFRGFIEEIRPDFGTKGRRQTLIECVDAIALLDLYEGELAIQTDIYADDIINTIVNACYTPPSTSYQVGLNLYKTSADRWSWDEGVAGGAPARPGGGPSEPIRASDKILDACTADWGRFFVAGDGETTYFNRHQMALDDSTELTLTNTMVDMAYAKSVTDVYNFIEIICHPRTIGEVNEVLGRIRQGSAPSLQADDGGTLDTQTFTIWFRDPADQSKRIGGKSCLSLVAGTDLIVTEDPEGAGSDLSASVSATETFYGDHAEIVLDNDNAGVVYIQKLQVRGLAVRSKEPVTVVAEDSTSQTTYHKRKLRINAPMMSEVVHAQTLADYLLDVYKDPQHVMQNVTFIANTNATLIAAARDLELMDKVEITETQTGLSSDTGHIYSLTHVIQNKWHHRVIMNLETAYDPGTPFRLDDSQLDSGHYLIY